MLNPLQLYAFQVLNFNFELKILKFYVEIAYCSTKINVQFIINDVIDIC